MYFIMICTWEPKDEKEVRTRRANWEWPKDVKVLYEFYDLQGCRTVYGLESDAVGLIAARAAWFDIIKFEIFPVYPIGETKKMLKK